MEINYKLLLLTFALQNCLAIVSVGSNLSLVKISQDELANDSEKFAQAMKDGFFYLEIPSDYSEALGTAEEFANTFYSDENLDGFYNNQELSGRIAKEEDDSKQPVKIVVDGTHTGYHRRDNAQVESFYIEKSYWGIKCFERLGGFAEKLEHIASDILAKVLEQANISKELWSKATAGQTAGLGKVHLLFNHYRYSLDRPGLREHKDFGFITVLMPKNDGLQVKINDEWIDVPPQKGYFVVNFSKALELLINNPEVLKAALHRVKQVDSDRVSFGISTEGADDQPVFSMIDDNLVKVYESYGLFIENCFKELY